ncbi:MAG: PIN domain-containing protein, partial [Acidobacteriales bacterium]|nr:PIN domain-containing protein [Terriglobales bacterium]
MKVYLDLCCLKRPFDDQSQPRIAVETAAVLELLKLVADGKLEAVRSIAHDLENSLNHDARRAAAVQEWLDRLNPVDRTPRSVANHYRKFRKAGLAQMDAFHLAWAEHLGAEALITTDDRFISKG